MAHNHESHASDHIGHIVPIATFTKVLIALLALTIITVLAAQIDLGKWNIAGAMIIASVKASLVIWFFMHGAHENKIIWIYIVIPFFLLALMIGGVFTDDPFRAKPLPFSQQKAAVTEEAPPASEEASSAPAEAAHH